MRRHRLAPWLLLPSALFAACQSAAPRETGARPDAEPAPAAPVRVSPDTARAIALGAMSAEDRLAWVKRHYIKREYRVPMRDGVHLFTSVYIPKDASARDPKPILLRRTPYSCSPYGEDKFTSTPGPPGGQYIDAGYIFVTQDVRGRFMSEGIFEDMRPHAPGKSAAPASTSGLSVRTVSVNGALPPPMTIDESTDTWDTIEWLVGNIAGNNGRVGLWGISYPGFYASAGMIDAHPALKAVAPMAPIADWYFDDFFHHGAFFLPHNVNFFGGFGQQRPTLTTSWKRGPTHGTPDGYQFFLDLGPLSNVNEKHYKNTVPFWNTIVAHPAYDEFWQARNILPHLKNTAPACMVVGGWFDAEDLYGALNTYSAANAQNPQAGPGLSRTPGAGANAVNTTIVMGPWFHGAWHRSAGDHLGNVSFGSDTSAFYQAHVEFPFFERHLRPDAWAAHASKRAALFDHPEALMFETGGNRWRRFEEWPPNGVESRTLWFNNDGLLSFDADSPSAADAFDEFVNDPAKPAPFIEETNIGMTRAYMTDDQRFAARRPDVLVYQTEPLKEDLTIAGPLLGDLWVSMTLDGGGDKCDSDWIVKLIDVLPADTKDNEHTRAGVRMGGYQQMVRSEVIRGRYRNSYERPEPFTAGATTNVRVPLQDTLHTFRKGHRIMVQVQSAWFPLVDRNPQKWVDNIFEAKAEDFTRATLRVHRANAHRSGLRVGVMNADALKAAAVPEADAYVLDAGEPGAPPRR